MPLPDFSFQDPITDTIDVPTKPTSETQLRQLLQGPSNELSDLYNNFIKQLVNSIEANMPKYAVDTGVVNALVVTPTPAYTNVDDIKGDILLIQPKFTNTSATVTINVNGIGVKNIEGLSIGSLQTNKIYALTFNGTNFQLLSNTNRAKGSTTISTDANGFATIPFGKTLVNPVVTACSGDPNKGNVLILVGVTTATDFQFRAMYAHQNAVVPNTSLTVNWQALGD